MKLQGKTIVVTGGTSGIGAACSRQYVAEGARVVMASIQPEEGKKLEEELGGQEHALFVPCDVTCEQQVSRLFETAEAHFGKVHGVHCNAGAWAQGTVESFDDAIWERVMGVNVQGVLWTLKYGVGALRRAGKGVVLVTTSVAAQIGFPQHAVYCASKAALEAIIRCMTTDYAGEIRVVGISPGTIRTPMLEATCQGWDRPVEDLFREVAEKIPVRRLGEPEDVAKAAVFLMSDDAAYINGTIVTLDGGTMALPPW